MGNKLILVQFQHVCFYLFVIFISLFKCSFCLGYWLSLQIVLYVLMFVILVRKLAGSGAKMVIISNSSRRASTTMEKIGNLGFDPSLFVGAITSGELTYQYLQRLSTEPWKWWIFVANLDTVISFNCDHITIKELVGILYKLNKKDVYSFSTSKMFNQLFCYKNSLICLMWYWMSAIVVTFY